MSTAFSRTARALANDGFRGSFLALTFALLLLGVWLVWFFLTPIPRYEVTSTARLEVDQQIRPVQSPVLARVVTTNLQLGREVHADDVLVELDSATERFQVQEETAHVTALTAEIASLRAQVQSTNQARGREAQTSSIAQDQAAAKFREADTLARSAVEKPFPLAKRHESRGTGDKSDPRCSLWTRIASVEGCSERHQHARLRTLPDPLALAISGNHESMRSPPQPD